MTRTKLTPLTGWMRACVLTLGSSLAMCCGGPARGVAQQVRFFTSSNSGDRLTEQAPVYFTPAAAAANLSVILNDTVRYQTIDGFGASFLEAGLMCINRLSPQQQESVLRALFDKKTGAGFSAMKTVIASTDFMSAGPFYSYNDAPGDVEMKHFSIARDLGPDGLITYIKRAQRYGRFSLEAPMDYPPDWMLVDVNKHQDVNPKYYNALSLYYLRYLQEYNKRGVSIDYLSPFNEPGNYTKISYGEISNLIGFHVGPLFKREHIRTKLTTSEPPLRGDAARDFSTVLSDPVAAQYIGLLPYHGYDFSQYNMIAAIHRNYPKPRLWMTEICYAAIAHTPSSKQLPRFDFADGDFWGNVIFNDLEASASAWIYWNMVLNERGGPWSVSTVHANPDPNVQQPVVIIDQKTKAITYTGLYYYLAHFSKFVRPGSVRIQTVGAGNAVRVMAFTTPDAHTVAVILNSRQGDTTLNISFHRRTAHLHLPARSITTAIWPNSPRHSVH